MSKKIFINLPVKDLDASRKFYEALGFRIEPMFSDQTAACLVVSEEIYVMILNYGKFKTFTSKDISDATKTTEVLNCLSLDSKEEVDLMYERALSNGGKKFRDPTGYEGLYDRIFEDLDGHVWEIMWMDFVESSK